MNVTLKPFDFAQAVARAGLATNGQPLVAPKATEGVGFQQALTQALGAVSQAQDIWRPPSWSATPAPMSAWPGGPAFP